MKVGRFTVIDDTKAAGAPPIYSAPSNGTVVHHLDQNPGRALARYQGAIRNPALAGAVGLSMIDPDGSGIVGEWIGKSREQGAFEAGYQAGAHKAEASKALVPAQRQPTASELFPYFMRSLIKTVAVLGHQEQPSNGQAVEPRREPQPIRARNFGLEPDDLDDDELIEVDERATEYLEAEAEPDDEPAQEPPARKDRLSRVGPGRSYGLPTYEQRVAAARQRAALEVVAERPPPAPRKNALDELLQRKKPEGESTRWEKWFGKPKKAVWK